MTCHQDPPDPQYILRGSDGEVTALDFLSDGNLLSGSMKGTITTWDLQHRRPKETITSHSGQSILWLHEVPHVKNHVISQGRDGLVHQWNIGNGTWMKTDSFQYSSLGFCKCDMLNLGTQAIIVMPRGSDSIVDLISMESKETVQSLGPDKPDQKYGMCMALKVIETIGADPLLCAGYENGSLILWDLKMSKEISKFSCHKDAVTCLDFCLQTKRGVSGSVDEKLVMWELDKLSNLLKLKEIEITNPGVNCVSVRHDGRLFATGGWDSRCRLFSGKTGKALAVLGFHTGSVNAVTFGPENLLAVGSRDCSISMWGLYQ